MLLVLSGNEVALSVVTGDNFILQEMSLGSGLQTRLVVPCVHM